MQDIFPAFYLQKECQQPEQLRDGVLMALKAIAKMAMLKSARMLKDMLNTHCLIISETGHGLIDLRNPFSSALYLE